MSFEMVVSVGVGCDFGGKRFLSFGIQAYKCGFYDG